MTNTEEIKKLADLIEDYQAEADCEHDPEREAILKELVAAGEELKKELLILVGYDAVFPQSEEPLVPFDDEDIPY